MDKEMLAALAMAEQNSRQKVPPHTMESLLRYRNDKIPCGGFLTALLANDLMEAYARADDSNIANMYAIVKYVYCEMPITSHGSYEIVERWLKRDE